MDRVSEEFDAMSTHIIPFRLNGVNTASRIVKTSIPGAKASLIADPLSFCGTIHQRRERRWDFLLWRLRA